MRRVFAGFRKVLFGRHTFNARQDLTLDNFTALSVLSIAPFAILGAACPGIFLTAAFLADTKKSEKWLSSYLDMHVRLGSIHLNPLQPLPFTIKDIKFSRLPGSMPTKPYLRSYDVFIDQAQVTFSLSNFLKGNGWIKAAHVQGIRGTVFDPPAKEIQIPQWIPGFGEFQLSCFSISDMNLNILNYGKPYNFIVSHANSPNGLRSPWLFHDLITSQSIAGSIDGQLFNLHTPTSDPSTTTFDLPILPLSLLGSNIVNDGTAAVSATVIKQKNREKLRFSINLAIKDAKLSSSPDDSLSLPTRAILVRFINSNHTLLSLNTQFELPLENFYAAWSAWDSGLYSASESHIYKEIIRHANSNTSEKVKDVGLWSMKEVTKGLLIGFREMVDPLNA